MRNPFIRPGVDPEERPAFIDQAPAGVGLASALVSLLAGYSAYRDSRRVHQLYAPTASPAS